MEYREAKCSSLYKDSLVEDGGKGVTLKYFRVIPLTRAKQCTICQRLSNLNPLRSDVVHHSSPLLVPISRVTHYCRWWPLRAGAKRMEREKKEPTKKKRKIPKRKLHGSGLISSSPETIGVVPHRFFGPRPQIIVEPV